MVKGLLTLLEQSFYNLAPADIARWEMGTIIEKDGLMKKVLTIFLVIGILTTSVGCNLITGKGATLIEPAAPLTEELPTPPALSAAPMALQVNGSPEEIAIKLTDSIRQAPDNQSRLAAWLGVYAAFGIPVLDESGKSLNGTGDDPLGAPYWSIWYASGMDFPKRGMTLVDAGKILTIRNDHTYDPNGGRILLDDLQQALQSTDPQDRLLGLFIQTRIASASSGLDLSEASASPEQLIIDPASVNLLNWLLIRSSMLGLAKTEQATTFQKPVMVSYVIPSISNSGAGKPRCAEMFGSEETTSAVNYFINKFYNGISLPGTTLLPGMNETVLKQLGVSAAKVDKINSFVGRANAVAQMLSLYMQIQALQVDGEMDTVGGLERTKTRSDGKRSTITWHLYYDMEKVPDGNELWACMTSFLSNTMGVSLTIPPSEAIVGADIIFKPGKNIPEKVLIDSENTNYRIVTDSNGKADLKLIGRAQKKTLPDNSPEMNDTFTITVSAQPEAINAGSIAGMFWDSLSFWVKPSPSAAVAPLIDVLKTMTYDLGEWEFRLIDWGSQSYQIAGGLDDWQTNTAVCNIMESFTLTGGGFTMVFSGGLSGTYNYTGPYEAFGTGSYTISLPDGPGYPGAMTGGGSGSAGGATNTGTENYTLTPLQVGENCSQ